jgi:hypothetical protein
VTEAMTTVPPVGVGSRAVVLARTHRIGIGLFVGSYIAFAAFSGNRFMHQSKAPHFIFQAAAWLEGRLELPVDPPNQEDWAKVGDKFYVSFPAFPAVVMLPFVALWGYQFNDTSFTVFIAALNVLLFFLVLQELSRRGQSKRTELENGFLALLFAFGSLNFYCSIRGEVWFTAEVMGVTFTCLYILLSMRAAHPALAGLVYSAATLTRTPLMFCGLFFALEAIFPNRVYSTAEAKKDIPSKLRKLGMFAAGATPIAAAGLWFNYARFGNPLEFGHKMLWDNRVNADIQRWGLFSYQYLERNLHAAFTKLPTLDPHALRFSYDPHGLSLLVTTPLFLMLLWPKERPTLHLPFWLTVAIISIPGFFYQNDGYMQFGFRFSLDYTPYLFVLLALGSRPMNNLFWALAAAGLGVNTWGAIAFHGYSG